MEKDGSVLDDYVLSLTGSRRPRICFLPTVFHGPPRRVRGLGLLPYSNCVHYDAEPARRAEYHSLVRDGMREGFTVDDGVALRFEGTRLERVVGSRLDGAAYHVERIGNEIVESALEVSFLGASMLESVPTDHAVAAA